MNRSDLSKTTGPTFTDDVEHVVRQLNALGKAATFEFACAVGRLVIDSFYAGDVDRWRARDPERDMSFRKLSRHPDLPMSASALYRSVCIYEVCQRLDLREWKHISTSHIRLVLPLPPAAQEQFLRNAETNGWSVRDLDREVASALACGMQTDRCKGGRKRHPNFTRKLRAIENCAKALDELLDGSVETSSAISAEAMRAAIDLLRRTARKCTALEGRLRPKVPEAQTLPPPFASARGANGAHDKHAAPSGQSI